MSDKLVSVNESFDFPTRVSQRLATRLADTTKPEGQSVSTAVGSAVQKQVETPGSPLRLTLDTSYGRAATYNPTDRVSEAKARPNFVRTGTTLFSTANVGTESIYWLYVLETPPMMNLPGSFMWFTSTDHSNAMGGVSIGYSNSPAKAPASWKTITISGLPSGLKSLETGTPWVDVANNRILVYFQAQDENEGLTQDTHVMSTTSGTEFTYLRKLPDIPNLWPGDGHGGYLGPLMPYGSGYAAYSLAGGTDLNHARFMVTRDGLNWAAVGGPESPLFPGFDHSEPVELSKIYLRPFMWRGQMWAVSSVQTLNSAGAEPTYSDAVVFRVSDDYRHVTSKPEVTLADPLPDEVASTNTISCVLYYQGQLYAYYRNGGKTGSYRLAISEA